MAREKTAFVCQSCGHAEPKWLGRCPGCSEWNTLVEERRGPAVRAPEGTAAARPVAAADAVGDTATRIASGIGELDRVLGGGLVAGSLVLLGGDPGVGKSTLLLQALDAVACAGHAALYVSAEESVRQVGLRAQRLGAVSPRLLLLGETELEQIVTAAGEAQPEVMVVDSVQAARGAALDSMAGSIGQVREVAGRLLDLAKGRAIATVLVGHVTKDGALAGPKALEHVVDTVLSFEGERGTPLRLLRAQKNRFGPTDEVGVFEMGPEGLREVESPSAFLLAERPRGAPGSVVVPCAEGSRPLLVEIQALVAPAQGIPRRVALGIDPSRVALLLGVLDRRAGVAVLADDVFVNVAGGLRVSEPACDLGVLGAVASSVARRAPDPETLLFGEVGLAGEVRAVALAELRLREAARLGFRRCLLPEANRARLRAAESGGLELVGVRDVSSALAALLG
jgi:DNA repair protein RadA/Sms